MSVPLRSGVLIAENVGSPSKRSRVCHHVTRGVLGASWRTPWFPTCLWPWHRGASATACSKPHQGRHRRAGRGDPLCSWGPFTKRRDHEDAVGIPTAAGEPSVGIGHCRGGPGGAIGARNPPNSNKDIEAGGGFWPPPSRAQHRKSRGGNAGCGAPLRLRFYSHQPCVMLNPDLSTRLEGSECAARVAWSKTRRPGVSALSAARHCIRPAQPAASRTSRRRGSAAVAAGPLGSRLVKQPVRRPRPGLRVPNAGSLR
jgi:hypothetical protein